MSIDEFLFIFIQSEYGIILVFIDHKLHFIAKSPILSVIAEKECEADTWIQSLRRKKPQRQGR